MVDGPGSRHHGDGRADAGRAPPGCTNTIPLVSPTVAIGAEGLVKSLGRQKRTRHRATRSSALDHGKAVEVIDARARAGRNDAAAPGEPQEHAAKAGRMMPPEAAKTWASGLHVHHASNAGGKMDERSSRRWTT